MVKEKLNQIRTYDANGFRLRAACVCVRDRSEQEVLMVTASRNQDHWIVPGGGIEPTEDPRVAAVREVYEEAGVKGELGRCLGVFEDLECKTKTSVYVMIVGDLLEEWDDKSVGRKRQWFKLSDAQQHLKLHRPAQCTYLDLLSLHKQSADAPKPIASVCEKST